MQPPHRPHRSSIALLVSLLGGGMAPAQHGPTPVVVSPVVERDVPASLQLVGTVLAERSAVVAAEVDGRVAELPADEGQFLRRGEVLCRLDPTVAGLRLKEGQARLAALQARLTELENGTRAEELKRLEAAVQESQALFEKWDFEKKRVDGLFERGQGNASEKHDTDMEHLAAARRLTQAKAQYDLALAGPREEEIARAAHEAAAQQALSDYLQYQYERTEVRAPFDGFVVAKRTEVGEWIAAGGAVCEMVAIDTVRVRTDVPESAIPYCRSGESATVNVEALNLTLSGNIARVIPRAAESARTFPVEVDLANAEHTLLPGMFVWVHVPAGPAGKRLVVSKDAIVAHGTSKQIFVVRPGPGGTPMAMPTPVTTGLELRGQIEINAPGIQAGDQVVIRANERLFGPTPVIPTPEHSPPAGKAPDAGSAEPSPDAGKASSHGP